MKVMITGNLTIDFVENTYRIGGSGFYGGRALSEGFNVETYVLTNIDKNYRSSIINTMNSHGIKVLEIESETMPIFIISKGKAREFKGGSPKISNYFIEKYVKLLNPEIVILAPIMRELDINSIVFIEQKFKGILSVDIQGFVRSIKNSEILCEWDKDLEKNLTLANIVHGNINEFCFKSSETQILKKMSNLSSICKTLFLVSLDQRGTYAIYKGEIFYIPSLNIVPIDDVGAGDILLAITSYYVAKGENVLQATIKGVIAASLKVGNACTKWFNKEDVESKYSEHTGKIKVVTL